MLLVIKPFAPVAAIGAYALFWKGLQKEKRPFLAALLWFGAGHAVDLSWLLSFDYHGIYIVLVYVILIVLFSLPFALIPLGSKELWLLTCYIVVVEYAMQHLLLCGFTMQQVGLLLTRNIYTAQLASVLGVLGLTGYVIWTNFMLLHARHFFTPVALALFPYVFGAIHLAIHGAKSEASPKIKIALIQTALRSEEKRPLGSLEVFISPYEQWRRIIFSLRQETHYDLIVLPEVAVPFDAYRKIYDKGTIQHIFFKILGKAPPFEGELLSNLDVAQGLATLFHAELVIGLIDGQANAAFFLKDKKIERYVKQVLIPMAETLPFESLRALSVHYGIGGFLTQGREAVVFSSAFKLSPSICYEEMLPQVVREGRLKGGEVLVNMTNDVWFPSTPLPVKHFLASRMRTLENGVPLVRSCNTGVTVAVDSLGRILGCFDEEWKQGALILQLPLYSYKTVYLFFGEKFLLALSGFSLMFYPLRKYVE